MSGFESFDECFDYFVCSFVLEGCSIIILWLYCTVRQLCVFIKIKYSNVLHTVADERFLP